MKLLREIIDLDRPREVKHSLDPHTFPERMAGKKTEKGKEKKAIGHGATAVTFPSKKPNTITKTSYHDSPDDGYIQYIKTVMQHQNNPFFPRIYNAKIYKEGNTYALHMEMEKLIPLEHPKFSAKDPTQYNVFRHIFKRLGLDWDKHNPDDWDDPRKVNKVINATKNPHFAEALKVLLPLTYKHGSDLHRNNLMVRLTGSGPQLVITDPVKPSTAPFTGGTGRPSGQTYQDLAQDQTGDATPIA